MISTCLKLALQSPRFNSSARGRDGCRKMWGGYVNRALVAFLVVLFLVGATILSSNRTFVDARLREVWASTDVVTGPKVAFKFSEQGSQNRQATGDEEIHWRREGERREKEKNDEDVQPRVAICLVGGARAFELTGHSIKKYVLAAYERADLFLHAPLNEDAHKFTVLKDVSNLAMARIFENSHIDESTAAREVLTGAWTPQGIQGLLQQFMLNEGCITMIHEFEKKHDFYYDWIVRSRVDSFWNGPLPALKTLNPEYYHVPFGCRYGGFNDRFGIGHRNTSWVALSRVSLIPKLHERGYRNLNSEAALEQQFTVSGITTEFHNFDFCILTSKKYAWPLDSWGVPIASIWSKGSLNGMKCKPCNAVKAGDDATQALAVLELGWGWIPALSSLELQLCDASHDLEPGWEATYDQNSGEEVAQERQHIATRTKKQCEDEVRQFGKLWESWDAPSPAQICATLRH